MPHDVDTAAHIATAQTMHLSPYGVHSRTKADGGGDGGTSADANDGSASNDAADTGVNDSGFDSSACTPVAQQVGSCANHPIQICTAGKVFTNCVSLTPQGYSAYCCP